MSEAAASQSLSEPLPSSPMRRWTSLEAVSARSIVDVVHDSASSHGNKSFLSGPDGRRSFSELAFAVGTAAEALRTAGVAPGEPVILLAPNAVAFFEAWLGLIARGAIPVPLHGDTTPRELAYVTRDTGATAVVYDAGFEHLVERDTARLNRIPLSRLVTANGNRDPAGEAGLSPGHGHDCAALVYTSGTSGQPKGVMLSHATYIWAGEAFPRWLDLDPSDRLWTALPLHHINAQAYGLMSALTLGVPMAVTQGFRASRFWQDAQETDATVTNLVGGMLHRIARAPDGTWRPNALRLIYASPAGTPSCRREFESRFATPLRTGYGLTESVFGCIDAPEDMPRLHGVGRPRHHPAFVNELKIVDSAGRQVQAGDAGEIVLRNPAQMLGYWNAPDLTAARVRDGWLHTGDLGSQDVMDYVHLHGRLKEMLRRRGENISPWEVEQVLQELPGVCEAAVVGLPNDDGEEDIHAFVVPDPAVELDDQRLRRWCVANLAGFKVPDQFHLVDGLPKTPTDRVRKDLLIEQVGPR